MLLFTNMQYETIEARQYFITRQTCNVQLSSAFLNECRNSSGCLSDTFVSDAFPVSKPCSLKLMCSNNKHRKYAGNLDKYDN